MQLENASTIEKIDLRQKAKNKQKKKNKNVRIYRSFLTFVLVLCIIQMGRSTLLNVSKIVMYQGKIKKSEELQKEAKERHEILEKSIKTHNSLEQIESIARNNLKMAAQDEVLIIINKQQEEEMPRKTLKEKFAEYFFKEKTNKEE